MHVIKEWFNFYQKIQALISEKQLPQKDNTEVLWSFLISFPVFRSLSMKMMQIRGSIFSFHTYSAKFVLRVCVILPAASSRQIGENISFIPYDFINDFNSEHLANDIDKSHITICAKNPHGISRLKYSLGFGKPCFSPLERVYGGSAIIKSMYESGNFFISDTHLPLMMELIGNVFRYASSLLDKYSISCPEKVNIY